MNYKHSLMGLLVLTDSLVEAYSLIQMMTDSLSEAYSGLLTMTDSLAEAYL